MLKTEQKLGNGTGNVTSLIESQIRKTFSCIFPDIFKHFVPWMFFIEFDS